LPRYIARLNDPVEISCSRDIRNLGWRGQQPFTFPQLVQTDFFAEDVHVLECEVILHRLVDEA
jgi:hypothetical protein